MSVKRRRRNESDLVLLELIRLGSSDNWDRTRAARSLTAKQHSRVALRHAYRRVQRVRVPGISPVADRAAATLALLLADSDSGAPEQKPTAPPTPRPA